MSAKKRPVKVSELICDALCRLIDKGDKKYEDITIQDIVDEAQVCRNSFYRNYSSKQAIFDERIRQMCIEMGQFSSHRPEDFYGIVYGIFYISHRHRKFLRCYYEANSKAYLQAITSAIIMSNVGSDMQSVSAEAYYVGAIKGWICVGLLTEWIARDCDMPLEEICRLAERKCANI